MVEISSTEMYRSQSSLHFFFSLPLFVFWIFIDIILRLLVSFVLILSFFIQVSDLRYFTQCSFLFPPPCVVESQSASPDCWKFFHIPRYVGMIPTGSSELQEYSSIGAWLGASAKLGCTRLIAAHLTEGKWLCEWQSNQKAKVTTGCKRAEVERPKGVTKRAEIPEGQTRGRSFCDSHLVSTYERNLFIRSELLSGWSRVIPRRPFLKWKTAAASPCQWRIMRADVDSFSSFLDPLIVFLTLQRH